MNTKVTNPFVTGGYISPAYFCDRQYESGHLLNAITSRRNITLISLRRMGKTGLLKHVQYLLTHRKLPAVVIYVDLMPTMNGNEMLNALSSALLRQQQTEKGIFEKILSLLSTLRPRITYDSLTAQPSLELKVETPAEIQSGIETIFHYISDIKHELVFMLDEFQQINQYPEKNMEHLLRKIIQSYPTVPFIFSGSSKHMLEPMFSSAARPFYQSAELMYLDKIPEPEYSSFISGKFEAADKRIHKDALTKIFDWTRLHTFYVQHVCNLLYEMEHKAIHEENINEVFRRILDSYEPMYISFRKLIPKQQFRLLQAIAIENGISQPTSGAFIKKHNLVSASTVASSMTALVDKEMIVEAEGKWLVYDVFFSKWLEHQYGYLK